MRIRRCNILQNVHLFTDVPTSTPDQPGCQLQAASPIILVAYILLALSETSMSVLQVNRTLLTELAQAIAVLTGIKAYRSRMYN